MVDCEVGSDPPPRAPLNTLPSSMSAMRTKQQQLEWELHRRQRLAVPALVAGILYVLSGVIASTTLRGAPTVGLVKGIAPALRGDANPTVSPRAAEVKYLSSHAFGLIAGSVMAAIAIGLAALVVTFLYDVMRYRRPEAAAAGRPLVLYGGLTVAALSILSQVVNAINTHNFAVGHDFTNHAVDAAVNTGSARVIVAYAGLIAELAFAVGVIITALNAMRTGLLTRFMGILGIVTAVLFALPLGQSLSVISAFWLVGLGVLYMGRWPSGDPPAWAAAEAVAWPSSAALREARMAQRQAGGGATGRPARGRGAPAPAQVAEVLPEPAQPAHSASRKRKRKRGRR